MCWSLLSLSAAHAVLMTARAHTRGPAPCATRHTQAGQAVTAIPPSCAYLSCAGVGAAAGDCVPGLYVCGWLKRGPTGIIGTNLTDAEETLHTIAQDEAGFDWAAPGRAALQAVLRQRGVRVVDWPAWERLDAAEVQAGGAAGAVRVKQASLAGMLAAAGV